MSVELTPEMKKEILDEFRGDCSRLLSLTQYSYSTEALSSIEDYRKLEQLTYITEQMRLKLKMLGAPRISW